MNEKELINYIRGLIKNDDVCMKYHNMKNLFSYEYKEEVAK